MPDTPTNWNGAYSGSQIDSLLAKADAAARQTDVTALVNRVSSLETRMTAAENVNTEQDADIDAAITKANAAAPQATTYTKSESDTLLADKLDVDDIITEAEIDSWFAGA